MFCHDSISRQIPRFLISTALVCARVAWILVESHLCIFRRSLTLPSAQKKNSHPSYYCTMMISIHFLISFFISLLMITWVMSLCALILHSHLPKIQYIKKATHLNLSFHLPIWISHLIRRIGFVWATPSCLNSWGQIGSSSAFGFICALSSRMNSYLAGNNVDASNEENGHSVPLRLVNGHFRLPQFSYA